MAGALLLVIAVILGIGFVLIMWGVGIYNTLVTLRNRFENAFSQIEVQLQRRYDLIPNLVETVKGDMQHEKGTLEAVIQARNQAVGGLQQAAAHPGDPAAMQSLAAAEQTLSGTLGRLFALAEAYPDLKANQNMAQLTEELTSTENRVAFARQAYNDAVTAYNTYRESFPPNDRCTVFGHAQNAQFLIFETEKISAPPKVSFS